MIFLATSSYSYSHNFNVAELKQALLKAFVALGSDVQPPLQLSSQVKENFGGLRGDLFEVRFKEDIQKDKSPQGNAGWVFLFEQEETPHLISFSREEKKIKAFIVGKNLISEKDYKDYSFLKKINDEMFLRLTPQAMREHDHSSMHGGTVLMFVDDHMELSKSKQNHIFAYVSDKRRQLLPLSDFEKINFSLLSAKKSNSLKTESMKHASMEMMMVFLPDKVQEDAVLTITLKRRKGNTISRSIKLALVPTVEMGQAMQGKQGDKSKHEGSY